MKLLANIIGGALLLASAALLINGLMSAAPIAPSSTFSAAEQVAMQRWSAERGGTTLVLGLLAALAGAVALILGRMSDRAER